MIGSHRRRQAARHGGQPPAEAAIAERSHRLSPAPTGSRASDLIFDPLVFPVGTGDRNYIGSAVETIEGVRLTEDKPEQDHSGNPNVLRSPPAAGREVLNAIYLYHCTKAGLDYAIVNTERLGAMPPSPEEERRLAEDLRLRAGRGPGGRLRRPPGQAESRAGQEHAEPGRAAGPLHRGRQLTG